jgi:hypothetical protein
MIIQCREILRDLLQISYESYDPDRIPQETIELTEAVAVAMHI